MTEGREQEQAECRSWMPVTSDNRNKAVSFSSCVSQFGKAVGVLGANTECVSQVFGLF